MNDLIIGDATTESSVRLRIHEIYIANAFGGRRTGQSY